MKKIKIFIFLTVVALILNNCASIENVMDPQRKNNTDEFLVEKKSPLSMPPDFEKLPIPKNEKVVKNENEENNLKKLIVNNQTNGSKTSIESESNTGNFEKSLIEKIKNN